MKKLEVKIGYKRNKFLISKPVSATIIKYVPDYRWLYSDAGNERYQTFHSVDYTFDIPVLAECGTKLCLFFSLLNLSQPILHFYERQLKTRTKTGVTVETTT